MSNLLWLRPDFSDSIDGKPLATHISHLLWEFPYDRLPNNAVVAAFLRPEIVAIALIGYLLSKGPLKAFVRSVDFDGKSAGFRAFVAIHNLALAIFSGLVVANYWSLFFSQVQQQGSALYCDRTREYWAAGHGMWSVVFYLSKFWEFVDTWILVLKVSLRPFS